MTYKYIIASTCSCIAIVSFSANAALVGVLPATPGGTDWQAYYDDVADMTWLANANAAVGSVYDTAIPGSGHMNSTDANAWAASLNVAGVTGWRLPDTLQPDASCDNQSIGSSTGYNCTGSDMGNLFYNVLGNSAGSLTNVGPFSNVQSTVYWSATAVSGTDNVWTFGMDIGFQGHIPKLFTTYAWAVHSGDVSAVPIPAAIWLFSSGLIGLIGLARRRAGA